MNLAYQYDEYDEDDTDLEHDECDTDLSQECGCNGCMDCLGMSSADFM